MQKALEEARKAREQVEAPIGAVVVYENQIIGVGHNERNSRKNPLCHAEIMAIHQAAGVMGDWRLEGCTIYVTLEPCPMCAGAIVQSRITQLVFGAKSLKAGCAGTLMNLCSQPFFNHQVQVVYGVLEQECSEMLSTFFKQFRKNNKII